MAISEYYIYTHPLYPTKVIAYNCNLIYENSCSICWLFDHRTLVNHRCLGWSPRIFGFSCASNHQSVLFVSAIAYPYVNYVDEFIRFTSHKTFGFVEGKSHRISQSLPDLFILFLQLSFQTERRYLGMVAIFSRSTSSMNLVFFWDVHPPGMWYFLGFLAP